MKTIKNSKDITTLEVGDKVIFGNFTYVVTLRNNKLNYYLYCCSYTNNIIFNTLNLNIENFCSNLGIQILNVSDLHDGSFPEVKSLEALTALVSALFKEYEKQNELPKTWEEFCIKNKITCGESYIDMNSKIEQLTTCVRGSISDRNICTSEQEAEAFLALMQLRQLRKAYVKDWEPDWNCNSSKFCIIVDVNTIRIGDYCFVRKSLSFPTSKLAIQFLTNFKDLLEIAKPLL